MLFDAENMFSDDQDIGATADSTNIIDLGADRDITPGRSFPILIQVTDAFADAGSDSTLTITLETDSTAAFGSAATLYTSSALASATLVLGYRILITPVNNEQFLKLVYTVANGAFTSPSTISAGFILDIDNPANVN